MSNPTYFYIREETMAELLMEGLLIEGLRKELISTEPESPTTEESKKLVPIGHRGNRKSKEYDRFHTHYIMK